MRNVIRLIGSYKYLAALRRGFAQDLQNILSNDFWGKAMPGLFFTINHYPFLTQAFVSE